MLCLQLAVSLFLFLADLDAIYQKMEVSGQDACQLNSSEAGLACLGYEGGVGLQVQPGEVN